MKVHILLLVFVGLIMAPLSGMAQETTGNIEGRVLDDGGTPIAFVTVTVTGPSLQGARTVLSTTSGYFGVFQLPVGTYAVKIVHVSYQDVVIDGVSVRLGKTTRLEETHLGTQLHEAPKVVVTAKKPLLDLTTPTISGNLSPDYFEVLPVQRDYRSIVTLLPQADASYLGDEVNFSGATGLENKYFFDGVDVTDPYRGVTGTNLPYNFVRDIEVISGGYEAEYRSSLGGIVNVVTYSGGNALHGQAFGFFANNRLAGSPRRGAFEPDKGDFTQYDVGLRLGGPIQRDKLWFVASYNPSFETEDVDIPGQDMYEDSYVRHMFAGKLSWRATARTSLDLTVVGDPSERDAVGVTFGDWGVPVSLTNPDPYLARVNTGGYTVALNGNYFASDRFLLDYSVSLVTRTDKYQPATQRGGDGKLFMDMETGVWSDGYPERIDDLSTQTTAGVTGSLVMGDHLVKAGLEYRDNKLDLSEQLLGIMRNGDASYVDVTFDWEGTVHNRIPSVFVQDSWQVHPRLRLNAGLRWDGQYMVGGDGEVAQKIVDQYQPRLGFVYQPGEIGTHKIFGSAGRFYQELSTLLPATYHNEGSLTKFVVYDHDPRLDPSGGFEILGSGVQPEVDGLEGQHYDEFTLGYERRLLTDYRLGVRGIYRTLRQGVEGGDVDGTIVYGNPGRGALSAYPEMERDYLALVLTAEKSAGGRYGYVASYVLSRNEGNYTGLYNSDWGWDFPNANGAFEYPEMMENGDGLLPNDRIHIFKLSGFYRWDFRLTAGASLLWQSGTPRSIFEGSSQGPPIYNFAQQRGSAGRTPSILDANVRLAYDLFSPHRASLRPRLILDVFHIGSQRDAVAYDQVQYFGEYGAPPETQPNPTFGQATRYQPPTAVRLGMEVSF